jgi:hypothetical protein
MGCQIRFLLECKKMHATCRLKIELIALLTYLFLSSFKTTEFTVYA